MKKPTIYEIKKRTAKTSPYFFSRETLRFFGQTMASFRVYKTEDPNKFRIWAKTKIKGLYTERVFNAVTNELESINN